MEKKSLALIWIIVQVVQTAGLILLIKYIFELGVDPLNFSYQILLASAVYLLIFTFIKEPKTLMRIDRKSLLTIMFIGIIGGGITYGFGAIGLQKSTAINYAFLIQTPIFFTPVLAFFFLKEHLKPYKVALITLLLLGTYLVSTNGELIIPETGDLFIILSAVAFSVSVIFTKIALRKVSTITFSMYRALFGGISLMLFLFLINKISLDFNWVWIMITGFIVAVGIYAMNKVLEYATASYMQMVSMTVPVITAIFAYFALGEVMTPIQIIGGVLIIASGCLVHTLKI